MIDLHCHILPGIDDGATDLATSLAMARMFVDDGVSTVACTPHILPGLYHNTGPQIRAAVAALQLELERHAIPLRLITGADVHITPTFVSGLRDGTLLSLADSRYVLVEPPHHVAPTRLEDVFFALMVAGYVPILTHPERLSWVRNQYETIQKLVQAGVWMQITGGSLTGAFGRHPLYWAEKMLSEGCVHILATDAHDCVRRPPALSKARDAAERRVGSVEAEHLVVTRPRGIVANESPNKLPKPAADTAAAGDFDADCGSGTSKSRGSAAGRGSQGPADGMRDGLARRLRRFFER